MRQEIVDAIIVKMETISDTDLALAWSQLNSWEIPDFASDELFFLVGKKQDAKFPYTHALTQYIEKRIGLEMCYREYYLNKGWGGLLFDKWWKDNKEKIENRRIITQ